MSVVQASNLKACNELMANLDVKNEDLELLREDLCPKNYVVDVKMPSAKTSWPLHVSRSVDNLMTHRIKKNL